MWEEPWLPGVVGFKTIPKEQDIAQVPWLVSNLKSESGDGWDEQKLTRMLDDWWGDARGNKKNPPTNPSEWRQAIWSDPSMSSTISVKIHLIRHVEILDKEVIKYRRRCGG